MKTAKTERKLRLSWQTMCMSFPKSLQYPRQPQPSPADDMSTAFTYEGMGRSTQEITLDGSGDQVVTDFYYSMGGQILEEYVGGQKSVSNVFSPVYVNAILLRDRDTNGDGTLDQRVYFSQDANFNTTGVISTTGTVLQYQAYNSYGVVRFMDDAWSPVGSDGYAQKNLYQGMMFDAVIGWYFSGSSNHGRLYSPTMEVWNRSDDAGDINGPDENAFVAGNPIDRVDPTGLTQWIFAFEGRYGYSSKAWGQLSNNETPSDGSAGHIIQSLLNNGAHKVIPGATYGDENNWAKVNSPNGIKHDENDTVFSDFTWTSHAVESAVDFALKQHLDKPSCNGKYDTVVVIGHSFGGTAAWLFARKLFNDTGGKVKVDLVYMIDPRAPREGGIEYYPKDPLGSSAEYSVAIDAYNWYHTGSEMPWLGSMPGYSLPLQPGHDTHHTGKEGHITMPYDPNISGLFWKMAEHIGALRDNPLTGGYTTN
jgi:RHS repeat-associated protein